MVEKLFGDRRLTATTCDMQFRGTHHLTGGAVYPVSLDGQFLYAFDSASEPPQCEEEAVDFVIALLMEVRDRAADVERYKS